MRRLPRSIKTSFIYLSSDSTASLDTRHKQWHMNCAGDGRQKMARDSAHTQGGQIFGEHLHVWCCGTNIYMNACTHMQTSEKRRQKRVKKRYSVIATGNNYTLSLEVTRGDKNGRVGQEMGSVVVNPAINTREDACIALSKYLFSPTLVPQSCFYFIHVTKSLLFILACPSGSERLCFKNLMTLLYDFISEKYKAFVFFCTSLHSFMLSNMPFSFLFRVLLTLYALSNITAKTFHSI